METDTTRRDFLKLAAVSAVSVLVFKVAPTEAGGKPRTFAFVVDTTKCIGCGSCARACARENDVPEGCHRTWIERYTVTTQGKCYVESPNGGKDGWKEPPLGQGDEVAKAFFVPKLCNHCAKPACVQVCPVGATFRSPEGAILMDKERCVGCGYCLQACPYSARFMNPVTHTADKCTWCYHRTTKGLPPACVAVCPTGARRFGEVTEGSDMEKFLQKERLSVLRGELGTEPAVHYVGLSQEVR
jgi:Fe-S-cluster-containing dehydrogenase component